MVQKIAILVFILLSSLSSLAANQLRGVSATSENNQAVMVYEFSEAMDVGLIQSNVQDQFVQLIFPNAEMLTDKNQIQVGKDGVKSVDSTIDGPDMVRSKIEFENKMPAALSNENIKITADKNLIKVYLPIISANSKQIIASEKESEIPVFMKQPQSKETATKNPILKLIMSLAVIGLLSVGLILFSKWYSKNNKKTVEANKIRVLAQHHLGPRKQLMIVRVAGESMLLGVTDHNINMIKSLALIDDEIPAGAMQNFSEQLIEADQKHAVENRKESRKNSQHKSESTKNDVDEFIISSIKDKVSTTLKSMREI